MNIMTRTALWMKEWGWFALLFCWLAGDTAWSNTLYTLDRGDLENAVMQALIDDGAGIEVDVTFSSALDDPLHRSSRPLHLSIDHLTFDERINKWEAELNIYEGDTVHHTQAIKGRYTAMIDVPVVRSRMHKGDVILDDDLDVKRMAESRLRHNTVLDMQRIIGMAPRRTLQPGRPIVEHELRRPIITEKGDLVQVAYQTPYMEIRTLGEALEDASEGDIISIRNTESEIILRAAIIAPGIAEVQNYIQLSQQQR